MRIGLALLGVFLFMFYLSPRTLSAQVPPRRLPPPKPIQEKSFAGIVQFINGKAQIVGADRNTPVAFQSVLKTTQTLIVETDSLVKLVTEKHCISVIFGPAQLKAPASNGATWNFEGQALRWICPSQAEVSVEISDQIIQVKAGEVFIETDQLIVAAESVVWQAKSLEKLISYRVTDNGVNKIPEQPDRDKLIARLKARPMPEESRIDELQVFSVEDSRWILGGNFGAGATNHPRDDLSEDFGQEVHGFFLAVQQRMERQSIFGTLSFEEYESEKNRKYDGSDSGLTEGSTVQTLLAKAALRWSHERALSWYMGAQMGVVNFQPHGFKDPTGSPDSAPTEDFDQLALGVLMGIDYVLRFESPNWRWLGLYFGIQVNWIHTLPQEEEQESSFTQSTPKEELKQEGFSNYSVLFNFGPLLRF